MRRPAISLPLLLLLVVHLAIAAVDVSGTYTAAIQDRHGTISLRLTLSQSGATPLPGQPGPTVTGTMEVTGTPCFTSLEFVGALDGNVLNGAFTDAASRIDVQLTASDNQLAGPYSISAGPCSGSGGQITFTQTAAAATPTPTVAPSCVGDCDGDGSVMVDELIQLVNFALGNTTECSTCADGIPAGVTCPSGVTIAVIIQGVNHALSGCGGS